MMIVPSSLCAFVFVGEWLKSFVLISCPFLFVVIKSIYLQETTTDQMLPWNPSRRGTHSQRNRVHEINFAPHRFKAVVLDIGVHISTCI